MNRRSILRILMVAALVVLSYYTWKRAQSPTESEIIVQPRPQARPTLPPAPPHKIGDETIAPAPLKKGARPFYGVLPDGVEDINKLPMANKPAPKWKSLLEKQILKNGGDQLKKAEIIPQESYVIPDGSSGRYVERVIVKLTGKKGEYTSFFAEVDSQSGHVLKSWGAVIHERPHTPIKR